ncbi:DUF4377 domain-containing protein [Spirosoma validum]|uniref:DUF4377 domain-containing protein n=1 Tax=Spirosoma validum TaxID=2771355 RepID=A0A927GH48_9BACT|nr:DUF4377 domain-containing protein [Spirosoma validum]MBD2757300.1 DUF4377 domain-containing protein [Spirosoma validum]
MNRFVLSLLLVVLTVLSSCDKNDLKPDVVTMRVADHRQDCVGVGPQKCLLVKTDGDTDWKFFYSGIEGFSYEEGFEYQLLVKREPIANPPADGSSIRYTLVEIVDKIKM